MPKTDGSKPNLRLLRFYLGTDCYCVEAESAPAVLRWEDRLPAPGDVGGAIASVAFGGLNVPVYSLPRLLGLDTPSGPNGPILIARAHRRVYGVRVDRVAGSVPADAGDLRQLPEAARHPSGRLRGFVRLKDELALLVSPSRLAPAANEEPVEPELPAAPDWRRSAPSTDVRRLFCFTEPGGDSTTLFAFTLRQMIEIAQGLRIVPLVAGNACVYGLADWRGYVVPVVDPGALLGLGAGRTAATASKYAILRGAPSRALFAIPVLDCAAISTSIDGAKPLPNVGPLIRAAFQFDAGCLVLPDLDRLLAA